MVDFGRRAVGVAFVAVAVVLLLSPGGAGIYAAPVLLPVSWYMARRGGRAWRTVCVLLLGAVAATVVWAVAYVLVGGPGPETTLLAAGAGIFTIALASDRLATADG